MNKELRRIFTRYSDFIVPISIIAGSVIIFFGIIIPLTRRTMDVYQQGTQLSQEVDALKEKLAILDSYDEETLNEKLNELTAAIPIDKSIPSILQTIEQVGSEVGITVNSISFDKIGTLASQSSSLLKPVDRQFGSFTLPFSVSIDATIDQVQTFLERTAVVRRFLRANSFSLRFNQTEQLNIQIAFDAFYLPLQKRDISTLSLLDINEEDFITEISLMPDFSSALINQSGELIPFDPNGTRNPFTL